MADAQPAARDVLLFQRWKICQEFPGYRFHEMRDLPAGEFLRALELVSLARQVQAARAAPQQSAMRG